MKYEISSNHTKHCLAAALKEQMCQKSLNKISVSDIVNACGVNRKTFYYHFEDIYALLRWMLEEEAVEVVKHFDLLVDDEEAILFVMNYVEQNDHFIQCALNSVGREGMMRFFCQDFESVVDSIIEAACQQAGVCLEDAYRRFLCRDRKSVV